jgi:hypothetical protein
LFRVLWRFGLISVVKHIFSPYFEFSRRFCFSQGR